MWSLAAMTAAFWSGLTRKEAKYMLLRGDKEKLCKWPHGNLHMETEGKAVFTCLCLTCRCRNVCSNLGTEPPCSSGCVHGIAPVPPWFNVLTCSITPCHSGGIEWNCQKNVCLQHRRLDLGVNKSFWILLHQCFVPIQHCIMLSCVSFVFR